MNPPGEAEAVAWQAGYQSGVEDERTSEANIGIAGMGGKIEPARANPYAAALGKPISVDEVSPLLAAVERLYEVASTYSAHGTVHFQDYWCRDEQGNVSKVSKPVTDMPDWVLAYEDAQVPPPVAPRCYICGEEFAPGEVATSSKHSITGDTTMRHMIDCSQ